MSNIENFSGSNLDRDLFAVSLDPGASGSLQNQLADALRRMLVAAPGYAGARLPASRTLAAELSVSRTTVQAVYDQMTAEGYVTTRRGSGTFVASDIPHLASPEPAPVATPDRAAPWMTFQVGLPDPTLLPHRLWARHLERAWRAPDPNLLGRVDPFGWAPLREAICNHLAAWRHLTCDPDQVVVTSGASEALDILCRGLLAAGETVAIEDPCWPRVHDSLTAAGLVPHSVRIDADGFDAARIPDQAVAALVTPSRHYPTGRALPLPRRVALLDWAAQRQGLIIEDDYDSEFRYQGHPLPSFAGLDRLQHTLYLGSFSKLVSASLRIGYLVIPKRLIGQVRAYLARVGPRASLVPQPALASFMAGGDFAVHLRRMRRIYARRQAHLLATLAPAHDLLEIRPDTSGMHLCLPLAPPLAARVSDQEIGAQAAEAGLAVGALSAHSVLPDKPQALLLGYAGFDEARLSDGAGRLVQILSDAAAR
ncbi:MAG: PLP-dependent aminotransferase family protein [Pseudomonadota bacterium]